MERARSDPWTSIERDERPSASSERREYLGQPRGRRLSRRHDDEGALSERGRPTRQSRLLRRRVPSKPARPSSAAPNELRFVLSELAPTRHEQPPTVSDGGGGRPVVVLMPELVELVVV